MAAILARARGVCIRVITRYGHGVVVTGDSLEVKPMRLADSIRGVKDVPEVLALSYRDEKIAQILGEHQELTLLFLE